MRRHLTVQKTLVRSRELLLAGKDVENLKLLEEAIDRFPDDPEIRLPYGSALVLVRPEEAPWQLATAIDLDKTTLHG